MGEFLDISTCETDEMAVGGFGDFRFVVAVTFSEVYLTHKAALYKEVQCPVYRSQGNFLASALQPPVDIIGIVMNVFMRENFLEDQLPGPGKLEVLGFEVILEGYKFHGY